MNCRKCGAKQITRRSAGVFSCAHCGVQPGPFHLDRFANVTRQPVPLEPELPSVGPLREVAPRQPRQLAGLAARNPA